MLLLAFAVAVTSVAALKLTSRVPNVAGSLRSSTVRFGVNRSGESRKKKMVVETNDRESSASKLISSEISASSPSISTGFDSKLSELDAEKALAAKYAAFTGPKVEALDEKIERLRVQEAELMEDASVGAVPEIVANRMISRITAFFGVPVFLGMSIFAGSVVSAKKFDTVVPPYVIAYATQVPFVAGLIGITYAIMSSSWDEDREGSWLGFDEATLNLQRIRDGFDREKETAKLKDDIERESNQYRRGR